MSLSDWLSLALICLLGASSPGPSLIVILASTRRFGRRAGLSAAFGHGLGVFFYALAAATALGLILARHAALFSVLQAGGAVLLVYVGWRLLSSLFSGARTQQQPTSDRALKNSFRDGLAIALFNPKIAAFFASLFSQFIAPGQSLGLHAAMAGLAGFIDTAIYVLFVLLASMKASISFLDRFHRQIDIALGAGLVALGLSLLLGQLDMLL